ncbi:MAG: hypothetical protein C5B54_10440 [Acidobacteria bacterium]|nr:MAG: hypothetical protein C5B54_10440 [Acidobacteriota bacterium]
MNPSIDPSLLRILAGILLLLFGRRLFWLFVGILGFVIGFHFAEKGLGGQTQMVQLLIAVVVGIAGALIAIFLQRLAIGIAGFFTGVYLTQLILAAGNWQSISWVWLLFLLGGVICAAVSMLVFDWALIILSSLTGAGLIIESLHLSASEQGIVFLVLAIVGIFIQAGLHRKDTPARST